MDAAEKIATLKLAVADSPTNSGLLCELGNLLYELGQRQEAIGYWERAVKAERRCAPAWRNLGVAYFNVFKDARAARGAFERAVQTNPRDACLLYERDQLWKLLGEAPQRRLEEFDSYEELPTGSEDLNLAFCELLNGLGLHDRAMKVFFSRTIRGPGAIEQAAWSYAGTGRPLLWQGRLDESRKCFETALSEIIESPGQEAATSRRELHYWAGMANRKLCDEPAAERSFKLAAAEDAAAISVQHLFAALALRELGQFDAARGLFEKILARGAEIASAPPRVEVRSLMATPPFDLDITRQNALYAKLLEAAGRWGLGEKRAARILLGDILRDDPNNGRAADLKASLDWED